MLCSTSEDKGRLTSQNKKSSGKIGKRQENAFVLILIVCSLTVGVLSFLAGRLSVQGNVQPSSDITSLTTVQYTVSTAEKTVPQNDETITSQAVSETLGDQTSYVYVTRTGKKYHRVDCSYLREGGTKMTKQQAEESGLTPCSRCNP